MFGFRLGFYKLEDPHVCKITCAVPSKNEC